MKKVITQKQARPTMTPAWSQTMSHCKREIRAIGLEQLATAPNRRGNDKMCQAGGSVG
jgi:hypothetical protein